MSSLPNPFFQNGVPYKQCNQCGKCSSGCPASRRVELKPRRIILFLQQERIEEILESQAIWQCTQCHQCMERCPRKVTPFDAIITLQNLAVKRGYKFPENLSLIINALKKQGIVQGYQEVMDREFEVNDRTSLELPELCGPVNLERFREAIQHSMQG
jgi:heterodisulfide reductase subunit C